MNNLNFIDLAKIKTIQREVVYGGDDDNYYVDYGVSINGHFVDINDEEKVRDDFFFKTLRKMGRLDQIKREKEFDANKIKEEKERERWTKEREKNRLKEAAKNLAIKEARIKKLTPEQLKEFNALEEKEKIGLFNDCLSEWDISKATKIHFDFRSESEKLLDKCVKKEVQSEEQPFDWKPTESNSKG